MNNLGPQFPKLNFPNLKNVKSIHELEAILNMPLQKADGTTITWLKCFVDACRIVIIKKKYITEESFRNNNCQFYSAYAADLFIQNGIKSRTIEGCKSYYFLPTEIRQLLYDIYKLTSIITPYEMMDFIRFNIISDKPGEISIPKKNPWVVYPGTQDYEMIIEYLQKPGIQELLKAHNTDFRNTGRVDARLELALNDFHVVTIFELSNGQPENSIGMIDLNADQYIQLAVAYDKLRADKLGSDISPNPITQDKPWIFNFDEALKQGLYLPYREENLRNIFRLPFETKPLDQVFEVMQSLLQS